MEAEIRVVLHAAHISIPLLSATWLAGDRASPGQVIEYVDLTFSQSDLNFRRHSRGGQPSIGNGCGALDKQVNVAAFSIVVEARAEQKVQFSKNVCFVFPALVVDSLCGTTSTGVPLHSLAVVYS